MTMRLISMIMIVQHKQMSDRMINGYTCIYTYDDNDVFFLKCMTFHTIKITNREREGENNILFIVCEFNLDIFITFAKGYMTIRLHRSHLSHDYNHYIFSRLQYSYNKYD